MIVFPRFSAFFCLIFSFRGCHLEPPFATLFQASGVGHLTLLAVLRFSILPLQPYRVHAFHAVHAECDLGCGAALVGKKKIETSGKKKNSDKRKKNHKSPHFKF